MWLYLCRLYGINKRGLDWHNNILTALLLQIHKHKILIGLERKVTVSSLLMKKTSYLMKIKNIINDRVGCLHNQDVSFLGLIIAVACTVFCQGGVMLSRVENRERQFYQSKILWGCRQPTIVITPSERPYITSQWYL